MDGSSSSKHGEIHRKVVFKGYCIEMVCVSF